MKKFNLLMKTLLMAVGLLVGTSAWATDYYSTSTSAGVTTTTMLFNQYAYHCLGSRGSEKAFVLTSNSVSTAGSSTAYVVEDFVGDNNLMLFNYIAMNDAYTLRYASSKAITDEGTSDGIYAPARTSKYVSIVNLHVGDKVKVYHNGYVKFESTNVTVEVEKGNDMTSATEYEIASGTHLDLLVRNGSSSPHAYIGRIEVTSNYDAVSNPSIAITARSSSSTTATITAGKSTSGSTVTTYYTKDGRKPTPADNDGSFTTATGDVVLTSSNTLKAISVTSGTYGGSSYVVSKDIEVEPETLVAPTLTITGFTQVGSVYYPTYTFSSDQSTLVTAPDASDLTYTYTFASGEATEAASYASNAAGTLSVTVSADGYNTSAATVIEVGSYTPTYTFDGSKIYDHATYGSSSYSQNGAGCNHYSLDGTHINGLTTSGLYHSWQITANKSNGLCARTSNGSVTYTGTFPDGSYIRYYKVGKEKDTGSWQVSSTNSVAIAHYDGLTSLTVLMPTASATAYTILSGTDLTNNGTFTSNISGWETKGTITKESDSSTSGTGFWWNSSGFAEMWASNDSGSDDYAHYNSDCYIAQRYVNLPAGNYCVTADLVANGGNVSAFTISVNGEVKKTANGYFDSWTTKTYVVNVPSDGGCITVKYCPQDGGRAWVGIDNVSCVYDFNDVSVDVTNAGYATYVPSYDLDFSETALKAYTVEVASKGVATLHPINKVPAGTPVLLIGATEDVPVAASTDEVPANNLVAGTGAAVATDGGTVDDVAYTNMILNNVSGIGFYFAAGQTVDANRAYLHFASTLAPKPESGAPMLLVFANDDITGISATLVNSEKVNSDVYDLQGRKVLNPTKGLYIVNGKKVIIK